MQKAFATQAVATLEGQPVANALPDDSKFPANARHPEVVLNFSNAAAATSAQTHLSPPSGKVMFPVPPAAYSKFFLFFNGAAGGTTIKVTLTYTDGMSTANATIPERFGVFFGARSTVKPARSPVHGVFEAEKRAFGHVKQR